MFRPVAPQRSLTTVQKQGEIPMNLHPTRGWDTILFISPLQYHQIMISRIKLINIEMKQDRISTSQLSKTGNFFLKNLQVLSFLFNGTMPRIFSIKFKKSKIHICNKKIYLEVYYSLSIILLYLSGEGRNQNTKN